MAINDDKPKRKRAKKPISPSSAREKGAAPTPVQHSSSGGSGGPPIDSDGEGSIRVGVDGLEVTLGSLPMYTEAQLISAGLSVGLFFDLKDVAANGRIGDLRSFVGNVADVVAFVVMSSSHRKGGPHAPPDGVAEDSEGGPNAPAGSKAKPKDKAGKSGKTGKTGKKKPKPARG